MYKMKAVVYNYSISKMNKHHMHKDIHHSTQLTVHNNILIWSDIVVFVMIAIRLKFRL